MSGKLATGVDRYTLIAWAQVSETGSELDIMESISMKSDVCQANTLKLSASRL